MESLSHRNRFELGFLLLAYLHFRTSICIGVKQITSILNPSILKPNTYEWSVYNEQPPLLRLHILTPAFIGSGPGWYNAPFAFTSNGNAAARTARIRQRALEKVYKRSLKFGASGSGATTSRPNEKKAKAKKKSILIFVYKRTFNAFFYYRLIIISYSSGNAHTRAPTFAQKHLRHKWNRGDGRSSGMPAKKEKKNEICCSGITKERKREGKNEKIK